ncbi:MAG: outer membrane lipoprotein-sorting protein [Sandaracinaceae bacterium]
MTRPAPIPFLPQAALLSFVVAAGAPPPRLAAQEPTPPSVADISRRLDTMWTSDSSIARIELHVVRSSGERSLRMRAWTHGTNRALVVVESPERERGTATLRRDRNLWTYLPRVARTMRVPPSMMLASWMGSDFTNDDLTQSASYREDFDGSIAGRSDSPAGWLFRYEARDGVVGLWRRVDFVISDDGLLPIEARYFDRRMRLSRTMRFDDVRRVDGRTIPTRLSLQPVDRPDEHTELRYLDIDFDANVPDSTFSLTELERGR